MTDVIGGIVGIQSRLKTLVAEDLSLLASSATFLFLIPIIGGFLALLLFLMLIGGLVQGDLFPTISIPGTGLSSENGKDSVSICTTNGISTLTCVVGLPTDY